MDLAGLDAARYHNFPTEGVIRSSEQGNRLGGREQLMSLTVVSNPDLFFIRNAKVNSYQRSRFAPFQLPQPLVGGIKVPSYGHCKDTSR